MNQMAGNEVNVLKLSLHDKSIGYLAGYQNGRNVLSFTEEFKQDINRPTFSLTTHPKFPYSGKLLAEPWVKNQRLHPSLSNLLPEGSLRVFIAQWLKVHVDNEFQLISYLGKDLPGALVVKPVHPDEVPASILATNKNAKAVEFNQEFFSKINQENKFSLAGVQMKFSMQESEGRYNLPVGDALGGWIIKTPSTVHKDVPLNEFTAMSLAALVGVDIPEIKLVELDKLDNLPNISLPNERFAFAIKRFDRSGNSRIHMEDFAQILAKYPHEKYNSANYEQINRIIYNYSGDGLADVQQFARRLLVNILLANGDAHLKNWSLIYTDKITPRFSPAYDLVTTSVYTPNENSFALNLGKNKHWQEASFKHFEAWANQSGVAWQSIKPHLKDVLEKAKDLWPEALKTLPMNQQHKLQLQEHWAKLHQDFRL